MNLIFEVCCISIPVCIQNEIISYVPLHTLLFIDQSQIYFPDKYEFFMRKPRPVFGPMVWFDRILHRHDQGVVLYGLKKMETEYGETQEQCESWDYKLPSRKVVLHRVMTNFSLSDHSMCNSGFLKLISDPSEQLTDSEVGFIESHFVKDWITRIDSCLFSDNSTLEVIMRYGYGELVFAMLYGILMNVQFKFELKYQVARYFMVNAVTDDKMIFSQGVIAQSLEKFHETVRLLAAYPSENLKHRKQMADMARSLVRVVDNL